MLPLHPTQLGLPSFSPPPSRCAPGVRVPMGLESQVPLFELEYRMAELGGARSVRACSVCATQSGQKVLFLPCPCNFPLCPSPHHNQGASFNVLVPAAPRLAPTSCWPLWSPWGEMPSSCLLLLRPDVLSSHDLGHTDLVPSFFQILPLPCCKQRALNAQSDSPGCGCCPHRALCLSVHLSAQQWGAQGCPPLPWQGKNQVMLPQHRHNFCSFSWKGRVWSHLEKPPLKLAKQEAWSEG